VINPSVFEAMLPPLPVLSAYQVSETNGFLPADIPLEQLPNAYYTPWEAIVKNLQSLMLTRKLRTVVDRLPVLSTAFLMSEAEWRRTHLVLSMIAHAYIWGGDTPSDVSEFSSGC
jgi:indoleamine 2,3-dioxygenase